MGENLPNAVGSMRRVSLLEPGDADSKKRLSRAASASVLCPVCDHD
jgi:hypothetical protein